MRTIRALRITKLVHANHLFCQLVGYARSGRFGRLSCSRFVVDHRQNLAIKSQWTVALVVVTARVSWVWPRLAVVAA